MITLILLCIGISIAVPTLLKGICFCLYNTGYGIDYFDGWDFSTQATRRFYIENQVCAATSICHIYATVPSNTANFVFINVHTGKDVEGIIIKYSEFNKNSVVYSVKGTKMEIPKLQPRGDRYVYSSLLENLNSSTIYTINIYNQQ